MKPLIINGKSIDPGTTVDLRLPISESYTGDEIGMPVRVMRAPKPGPTLFITAAIHGDEINGTGIIHNLMFEDAPQLKRGSLIMVPVVNVLGFENQTRYLPDRRDLNRCFPGSYSGSMAARIAHMMMAEIVANCDFGIDLHSASAQRTNYPNVRADMSIPEVARLARSFECSLIVNGKGPEGAFRREACSSGCATIILEAGEVWKIEPGVLKIGVSGIRNALIHFDMIEGTIEKPPFQTVIDRTTWVRAELSGILKFHVSAGEIVKKGQLLATNYSILGQLQNVLSSPDDGIVLGMTTMPAVKPGEPVCHIAIPAEGIESISKAVKKHAGENNLFHQIQEDLATNVNVVEAG